MISSNSTLPEKQIIPTLLETLETTRFFLEKAQRDIKDSKKAHAVRQEVQQKIEVLENYKTQLYSALSNLDYAYHQGLLAYDEYQSSMAAILQNKTIDQYMTKIDHLIQSCKDLK